MYVLDQRQRIPKLRHQFKGIVICSELRLLTTGSARGNISPDIPAIGIKERRCRRLRGLNAGRDTNVNDN